MSQPGLKALAAHRRVKLGPLIAEFAFLPTSRIAMMVSEKRRGRGRDVLNPAAARAGSAPLLSFVRRLDGLEMQRIVSPRGNPSS